MLSKLQDIKKKPLQIMYLIKYLYTEYRVSQVALVVKNQPANAGDIRNTGSTPGWGRPPGGGHRNPF